MSDIQTAPAISMSLNSWRGYSAYEIAVQNGFEGTETEWLASLKGEPGDAADGVTVNGREAVEGNITLRGTDIYVRSGTATTIAQALEGCMRQDAVVDSLESDDTTKPLSAAKGRALNEAIALKPDMMTASVTLSASGWTGNQQTVAVDGLKALHAVIVTAAPETYEHYSDCIVRCSAQGEGTLTFTASYTPSQELRANVLIFG